MATESISTLIAASAADLKAPAEPAAAPAPPPQPAAPRNDCLLAGRGRLEALGYQMRKIDDKFEVQKTRGSDRTTRLTPDMADDLLLSLTIDGREHLDSGTQHCLKLVEEARKLGSKPVEKTFFLQVGSRGTRQWLSFDIEGAWLMQKQFREDHVLHLEYKDPGSFGQDKVDTKILTPLALRTALDRWASRMR